MIKKRIKKAHIELRVNGFACYSRNRRFPPIHRCEYEFSNLCETLLQIKPKKN